jgi:hypothetical protein
VALLFYPDFPSFGATAPPRDLVAAGAAVMTGYSHGASHIAHEGGPSAYERVYKTDWAAPRQKLV